MIRPGQPERLLNSLRERGVKSPSFVRELTWLWHQAYGASFKFPESTMLEFGTLNLVSALHIADGVIQAMAENPERNIRTKVITVDNYGDHNKSGRGHSCKDNLDLAYSLGYSDVLSVKEEDDEEYLVKVENNSLSFLYIDSWHAYKKVIALLNLSYDKMIAGSLLAGHDYTILNSGVILAVEEWKRNNPDKWVGFAVDDRNWWVMIKK